MKTKNLVIGLVGAAAVATAYFMVKGTRGGHEIEYRYAAVATGDLTQSTSSTGLLVPLTQVDVKSKAGGIVFEIAVVEGDIVKQGDLIALIDPRDTQSAYDQAQADATGAGIRVAQAETALELELLNAETRVTDAKLRLSQAEIRREKARETARIQPDLTAASIATAEANFVTQTEAMNQLKNVDVPQRRKDAASTLQRTTTDLATAKADVERQKNLLDKGYVSIAVYERAVSSHEAAKAAKEVADQRTETLEADIAADVRAQESRVRQADAGLKQANANSISIEQSKRDMRDAERAFDSAEIALQQAEDARLNITTRRNDIESAKASAVRSTVAMQNALEQLEQTRVLAPRDGIVTLKYIEEGTIIPPGTSTFAQGTSIVQISDVSRMFVECQVDEADIASVFLGQRVKTIIEAYPGLTFEGEVTRVFPAAESNGAITTIKVRIELELLEGEAAHENPLRVGMNGSCEFIQLDRLGVLMAPMQAVKFDRDTMESYVMVRTDVELEPERRVVQLGDSGNGGIEVLSGLTEGEEVVIAEIDLAAMRERQEKMQAAEEGGGLSTGGRRR
jgi:HlyD family secretion protein